jgi:hypothetical protein
MKMGRRPQSDKDTETLRVRPGFRCGSAGEKPDTNGAEDEGDAEEEAEIAELFELSGFVV